MIDQLEDKKCLHAASADNLALMIIDNRPNPRAIQMVQSWAVSTRKTLGVAPGGCWRLELTDA